MNKKIKIIELLNRIANGEEPPKKIKKEELEGDSFEDLIDNLKYFNKDFSKTLNDEVEISEDKIEEINKEYSYVFDGTVKLWSDSDIIIIDKINELVKAINELRKEKEKWKMRK